MPVRMTLTFENFKQSLLGALAADDFYQGKSLTAYLQRPENERSGDEADIVDDKIARPLLKALGFSAGEMVYNRTGDRGRRPDWLVKISEYPRPTFIVEDKNTTEDLDSHLLQLQKYMSAHGTSLGVLTNGRELRVYEVFNGIPVMAARVHLHELARQARGETLGLTERELDRSLRAVFTRCRRDAFAGMQARLDELTLTRAGKPHTRETWPSEARITVRSYDDEGFSEGLVDETRHLIDQLNNHRLKPVGLSQRLKVGIRATRRVHPSVLKSSFGSAAKWCSR